MKWEDMDWGVVLLALSLMMLYLVFLNGCASSKCMDKDKSCPEEGHGPCPWGC